MDNINDEMKSRLNNLLSSNTLEDTVTLGSQFKDVESIDRFIRDVRDTDFNFGVIETLNDIAMNIDRKVTKIKVLLSEPDTQITEDVKNHVIMFTSSVAEYITLFSKVAYIVKTLMRTAKIIPNVLHQGRDKVASEGEFLEYRGHFNDNPLLTTLEKSDLTMRDLKVLTEATVLGLGSIDIIIVEYIGILDNYDEVVYNTFANKVTNGGMIPAYNSKSVENIIMNFKNHCSELIDEVNGLKNGDTVSSYDESLLTLITPRTMAVSRGYTFDNIKTTVRQLEELLPILKELNNSKIRDTINSLDNEILKSDKPVSDMGINEQNLLNITMLFRKLYGIYVNHIKVMDEAFYNILYGTLKLEKEELHKEK